MGNCNLGVSWSTAEDAKLRDSYLRGGIEAARRALPDRSKSSICHRAQRLGLKRRRRWTPADDRALQGLWGTKALGRIAGDLKRTPITVYWRAKKLGLERGCVQGFEYLTAAAARTGYTSGQLREILAAASVKPARSMSRPCRGKHRFHVVDPIEVDDAVALWLASEVVTQAAERRGMIGETLRKWLLAALARGTKMPAPPVEKKHHWRVPSETIDAVIAWEAARESLSSAALRTGVKRWKLRLMLLASGVELGRAKPWQVLKTDVDRVVSGAQEARNAG